LNEEDVPVNHKMPLYLVIQARTGLIWGLRDILNKAVDEVGLVVIDHRSWHPRGLDAIVVTEIYVQDRLTQITIPESEELQKAATAGSDKDVDTLVASTEEEIIDKRCKEVTESKLPMCSNASFSIAIERFFFSKSLSPKLHCCCHVFMRRTIESCGIQGRC